MNNLYIFTGEASQLKWEKQLHLYISKKEQLGEKNKEKP